MNFWSVTLNVNYEIRKIHRKKREKITSHKENTSHPPPPPAYQMVCQLT